MVHQSNEIEFGNGIDQLDLGKKGKAVMYKRYRVKLSKCSHRGADYPNSESNYHRDGAYLDQLSTCGNCQGQ